MKAGTIISKGPRKWLVRWYVGKDGTGKRIYSSTTVTGPLGEARRVLAAEVVKVQQNGFIEPNKLTVEQFYPDWLASKKKITPNTRSQYEERITQDVLPYFGKTLLKDVSPKLVQTWIGWMETERQLSARTIQYSVTVFKQMFKRAVSWHLVPSMPFDGIELPQVGGAEDEAQVKVLTILTPEEIGSFLGHSGASEDPFHALWSVLLTGGLRPQEALALEVSDFDGSQVSISKAVKVDNGKLYVGPTKTKNSRRKVGLPADTCEALKNHLKAHGIIAGLIFRNASGGLWDLSKVRKAWVKACKAAEVSVVRVYDARHSHATALLLGGVSLKAVSGRLGHASIKITADTYVHFIPEMDEAAVQAMNSLLTRKAV